MTARGRSVMVLGHGAQAPLGMSRRDLPRDESGRSSRADFPRCPRPPAIPDPAGRSLQPRPAGRCTPDV
ncbi:MAG: hypothetical protein MZU97_18660 [Bacillus subtilis]|nr:hypothetical protein [Bacillus subtilis]